MLMRKSMRLITVSGGFALSLLGRKARSAALVAVRKFDMKANKCAVVSRRMLSIKNGNYAPKFEEELPKRKYNPYDNPNRNIPQYNGRISW